MDLNKHLKIKDNIGYLELKIVPNSNRNELIGLMGNGVLKIRIKAIPESGKANLELIKFLSNILNIKKDKIEIVGGKTSQNKLVKIDLGEK